MPRHPQSQGSVERANSDIKDMMISRISDYSITQWSVWLRFVHFTATFKLSPYQALLVAEPTVGLYWTSSLTEILDQFQSEGELRGFTQQTAQAAASHSYETSLMLLTLISMKSATLLLQRCKPQTWLLFMSNELMILAPFRRYHFLTLDRLNFLESRVGNSRM